MEWSFKDDEDNAFAQFFAPKPTPEWTLDEEEVADDTVVDSDAVRNEYEGFEAALLKIAALDPIDDEVVAPLPSTHFVFDSFGSTSSSEPFDDEEDIIDIPFNPDPNFSFESMQFEKKPVVEPIEIFDYEKFAEEATEDEEVAPVLPEIEVNFDAERRFMGARRNELIFGNNAPARREGYGISNELFEVLRQTALLTASTKDVRSSYFTIVEDPSPAKLQPEEKISVPLEVEDLEIMQLRPVPRNSVGVMDRVSIAPKEGAANTVVTEAQVESIVDRARKREIEPALDPVIDVEEDSEDTPFFRDLSTKNNIFGSSMEIESKRSRKRDKDNSKWESADDDIFVAKEERHHHRRGRKAARNDVSDPITMEIMIEEGKKKSRLMEILTKKL
ncbi:MAG: hypothetical protein M0Z45_08090 [Actinomycetota bacterium]|nr:hypothetical protein [Actinomycetota bacterium]